MVRTEELKRQANVMWKQAVDQLDEVRERIENSRERFEADLDKLRRERDKLLKRVGDQTHKLAQDGTLPMPAFVKATVDRINRMLDHMMSKPPAKRAKKAGAKARRSRVD